MREGIYERLVREGEEAEVEKLRAEGRAWVDDVSDVARRDLLMDEISARVPELLDLVASASEDKATQARHELRLIAEMMRAARNLTRSEMRAPLPAPAMRLLHAIHEARLPPVLPRTGLKRPWLFTSGKGEPSLYSELRAELETAERLDILVSFIKKAGVRKLEDVFERVTATDAQGRSRISVRVLTTTYMGATDRAALDQLARYPGVQVRVSLDGRRERLHAKAWIFQRPNGFGTAFVGSANWSKSALINGIEWTVKLAQRRDSPLFDSARANFETLWNDPEFATYHPDNEEHRKTLDRALADQRSHPDGAPIAVRTWFDLEPKPFQQVILDRLAHEREHGRHRNLLVAATGTGKTIVSAFDYRRLCAERGGRPRLLFIAHQKQILLQAQATFRQVLRDPNFGELLDGQTLPRAHDHLFAMIQTLHSRRLCALLGGNYWQMVIVDEAHHVPAESFQAVVRTLAPKLLLGLTATPERLDGKPLSEFFDARPDGSPAYSLRIWDALDQQLLCPFEYYATADSVDFGGIDWGKAGEVAQLGKVLTGNAIRARSIAMSIERYVDDIREMKALAFCSGIDHAHYMADVFRKTGLTAVAISGTDSPDVREGAVSDLKSGRLQIICTVNLFNEGIDIPEVNTLFLLRPTQSPVVFQQQIGRGLRLHAGKSCCLVLDYIGLYDGEFRLDVLYQSLTGLNRKQLVEAADKGFGLLPPGCHIQLDKVSRERVLANLRKGLQVNARRLRRELLAWASGRANPLRLADFLHDQLVEASELYENRRSWQGLLRDSGLQHAAFGPEDDSLLARIGMLLHVDDPRLIQAWLDWLHGRKALDREVLMLAHQIFHERETLVSISEFRALLGRNPALTAELKELLEFLGERTDNPGHLLRGAPSDWPFSLHARYSRREILAGTGYSTETCRPAHREGILTLEDIRHSVMFVTLDKRQGFTETLRYRDFALSPDLFAWETQNRANPGNKLGQRFIESPRNGWRFFLFVRENADREFVALGEVHLDSWEACEQGPIPIVWKLAQPMSAELYRHFSVLRDA